MPAKDEPIGEECQVQDTSPICDLDLQREKWKFLKTLLILNLEEQRLEAGHHKNE